MGTNQLGDISWLSWIAQPSIAVFTNIGESHLEKLKSVKGVFNEKSKLLNSLNPNGYVIYNNDDIFLRKTISRIYTFSQMC